MIFYVDIAKAISSWQRQVIYLAIPIFLSVAQVEAEMKLTARLNAHANIVRTYRQHLDAVTGDAVIVCCVLQSLSNHYCSCCLTDV
jgi:hypothetical protein